MARRPAPYAHPTAEDHTRICALRRVDVPYPGRSDAYIVLYPAKISFQGNGGSISASAKNDVAKAQAGAKVRAGSVPCMPHDSLFAHAQLFLAGIALQLISFLFFTLLYLRFLWRIRRYEPQIWSRDAVAGKHWSKDWRSLAGAMVISCIGILVCGGLQSIFVTLWHSLV